MSDRHIDIKVASNYFPNGCSLNFNELIKQVAIKLNEENPESNYIINDVPCNKRVRLYIVEMANNYIKKLRLKHYCGIEMPRKTSSNQFKRLVRILKSRKPHVKVSAYSLIILLVIFEYLDSNVNIDQFIPYFNFFHEFAIVYVEDTGDPLGIFLLNCGNVIQTEAIINHNRNVPAEVMPPTLTRH